MFKENNKGITYTCGSKDFTTETGNTWESSYMTLVNYNITYSRLFKKLEMRQKGRDENGFYENYVYILINDECDFNVDEMLTDLGYRFIKREITYQSIIVDYDPKISDYIVEEE